MRLNRTIIHAVPKGKWSSGASTQVKKSTNLTVLNAATQRFISDSMVSKGLESKRDVIEDNSQINEFPSLVKKCFFGSSDLDFIEASQKIAEHLHRRQNGSSPEGILIISEVVDNGTNSVLVMKAEHSDAMRMISSGKGSAQTINLELLNDVIVGDNSKVFKIAVLRLSSTGGLIEGDMVDKQNGVSFADFFLVDFLGCKLKDAGEILTKIFVDRSFTYFNQSIDDADTKQQYSRALHVALENQQSDIDINAFIENNIKPGDQDSYEEALGTELVNSIFTKDLRSVRGGAEALRYYFPKEGASLTVPAEAIDSGQVTVKPLDDGSTEIKIKSNEMNYKFVKALRR